jgi:midasin (ATPase involved in ribosome maturation)
VIIPIRETISNTVSTPQPATAMAMQSIVNDEKNFAVIDETFVPWGAFSDIVKILKSQMFYPTYISGLSGNGKTVMVEQACAKLNREFIRVQINPETDEDDLLGGFRLINGETVFSKGPVLKAMENGAILLLDEIDRATNKIMCLQGILEGKPVIVKKTGETIHPAPGFNVIATANTKGKGSEDGRFTAASIIDEAFLERFTVAIDQQFPSLVIEKKIVTKHMEKFGASDKDFADKLVTWADVIRKTFYDDGVDEVISTRRLCHIVQTFSIFNNRMKAIDMCISRFDLDTKEAFLDLYTKVDTGAITNEEEANVEV